MSLERRATNVGKRERAARKRHKRSLFWSSRSPEVGTLKLGRKHLQRELAK